MLGHDVITDKWHGTGDEDYKASGSEIAYSLFINARYCFVPGIAVFAELGYGVTVVNLWLAFKF